MKEGYSHIMDEGQQGAVPQSYQPVPTYQPAPSYYPGPASPFPDIARVIKALLWSSGFLSFMCMLFISTIIMLGMTPEIQEWILTPQPLASDPSVEALPRDVIFVRSEKNTSALPSRHAAHGNNKLSVNVCCGWL